MAFVADPELGDLLTASRSPRLAALAGALEALVAATDGVAEAVQRHDREGLERANERADTHVSAVADAAAALDEDDRLDLRTSPIPELCAKLNVAARRNAYLIEMAWAIDAAEIRLLAGLGRLAADGAPRQYAEPSAGPAYVDRQA